MSAGCFGSHPEDRAMARELDLYLDKEAEQWLEEHKGWYECVYCGKVYSEQPVEGCCKENHFDVIGDE